MNILKNETDREEYLKKFYTEAGIIALEQRLKSLVKVYMDEKTEYPFEAKMFGFIKLKIFDKNHHEGMIDELCQILGKQGIVLEVKK